VVRRVNGCLPPSVRLLSARPVPSAFDARFSALSRRYVYRVGDAEYGGLPLRRADTVWHPRPLALRRMQSASRLLIGEHDFAAFCRRREGATTIRTLRRLAWSKTPDGVFAATVEADAFCHQMVRSLVGVLLAVGDGRSRRNGRVMCSRAGTGSARRRSRPRTGSRSSRSATRPTAAWRFAQRRPAAGATSRTADDQLDARAAAPHRRRAACRRPGRSLG
jgi:tRNA U38,U39,U40 pseudouridine synthase TruA